MNDEQAQGYTMKWEELSSLMDAVEVPVVAVETTGTGVIKTVVVPVDDTLTAVGSLEWAGFVVDTSEWTGFGNKPRKYDATEIKLLRRKDVSREEAPERLASAA